MKLYSKYYNELYDPAKKQLDNKLVISTLKQAESFYKQGNIFACKELLNCVVNAINRFDEDVYK